MWAEKKQRQQANWQYTSTNMNRPQNQLTPRQKQKPNIPLPNRNNLTPSRIEERVTTSPLRLPLENAINKLGRDRSTERQSRSRVLGRSSRREESSGVRRGLFEQEDAGEHSRKAHEETLLFLKKYFDFDTPIPVGQFIDRLLRQYQALWQKFNINQIIDQFTCEICDIFGGESIQPRELIGATRENGMLGLILHVFKLISNDEQARPTTNNYGGGSYGAFSRSPNVQSIRQSFESQLNECANLQHLKNIIQEFMQLMYKEMETQIYNKFNVEMRRMILKGREADKLLKKVQEKLVMNADYFESQKKWQRQLKNQEEAAQQLKKKLEKCQEELKRERENAVEAKNSRGKLEEENQKLKENLERYQNILFNKFQNFGTDSVLPSSSTTLGRKCTTPLMERTQQFNNQNMAPLNDSNKPFLIQIDTHFIQKDSGPPLTQTTTTFTDQNFPPRPFPSYPNTNSTVSGFSPLKYDSSRPSFEGGIKPLPKIGQYSYSPIQSRIARPY